MIYIVLIFLAILIIYFVIVKHIVIDFKSFFRKGFKKYDNAFRRVLLHAESKARARLCLLVSF